MKTEQIGKTIAGFRKKYHYTQDSLADKLGISSQAISKWENGICLPDVSLLVELSNLFSVSVDELLCHKEMQSVTDFMLRNMAAPDSKQLPNIPKISRWDPPKGCDMFYSMPATIAEALCCIEAYERGQNENVSMETLNGRFHELMHIMGIGYGFLWREKGNLIEELWHINDFHEMVDHAMRYYGRDYLWLTKGNALTDDMRKSLVWSIDRGHPVVMEWAGGIPEFSIVTGYENNGNTLIGWTYCPECAAKSTAEGMFVNPARWDENFNFHMLVIGDKIAPTFSDKDSVEYALEALGREIPGDKNLPDTIAGDAALRKWLDACCTTEDTIRLFNENSIYTYALKMNSIYAQKCVLPYFKQLAEKHNRQVNDIVIQIGIAIGIIESDRQQLESLKSDPAAYASACKKHVEGLLRHREYMRGWLKSLSNLLS